jgi:phosphopantetheine--protein transferase-like protein
MVGGTIRALDRQKNGALVRDESGAVRVGVDLASVDEVARSLASFGTRYTDRLFTPEELTDVEGSARTRAESLAARFAAKEAVLKVLRVSGNAPPPWTDIEVRRTPGGWPRVQLSGRAATLAAIAGLDSWAVSLTHEVGMAAAVVVASGSTLERVARVSITTKVDHYERGQQVEETIRKVLNEHGRLSAEAATVGVDDDLYRFGLTSHATVNVMLGLEDEFDIEFPNRLLRKSTFQSIRSIHEALAEVRAEP